MSKAIVLNEKFEKSGEVNLPNSFEGINSHNLYLYVKSYLASVRANSACTKTRSEVKASNKKPWAQKGGGRARAGSKASPIWVGGGVAHGPKNNRNYNLKVNKKQKKLALHYAINEKATEGKLFVVDTVSVESGKTKDAAAILSAVNARDVLVIKQEMDEKTFLAFRNLNKSYLIEPNELNGYLAAAYDSIIIEKAVLETITKEG